MELDEKLKSLGLKLPQLTSPGGNYVSVNVRNKIAYVAIQFPIIDKQYLFLGRLGKDLTTDDGYQAMQLCALNVLAQMSAKVGLENIEGLNHLDAYYQSANDWDEGRIAVNGASDLFVEILGDRGVHSRAIFGVERLPRNFCAGLTASFTLR